ncbi:MAG: NAD-binding protein [Actinobacteria bacterium]|nr:NAD-binding protein [Actinomycetota bacterium]MCG2817792.1 ion channel [Actinomycetes bacterium]MBU4178913.1 NAD-binding protein [Actinomycetota bacterium]MBU4218504.1 NAD-binding protein [Actinomycetota bacterium]MBU4359823.1 NAD-binding protein [Actinomycetota bacterium]
MSDSSIVARLRFKWERLHLTFQKKAVYFSLIVGLLLIIFLGSLVVLVFERRADSTVENYGDALWMMLVTLATVGFGDVVPITTGGRVATVVSMVMGIGLLSAFITTKAASMAENMRKKRGGRGKVKFKDHFVVCGWSSTGRYALSTLKSEVENDRTPIILLCDVEENPFDDEYVFFLRGNPASEVDLRRVNVDKARGVILLADESRGGSDSDKDARTVLAALTIKSIDPGAQITAEVLAHESVEHLRKAGVREIMDSSIIGGGLIARSALRHGLIELISEIVGRSGSGRRTHMVRVDEEMAGKEPGEVMDGLKAVYGPNMEVISIKTGDGFKAGDELSEISPGDLLIITADERVTIAEDAR